MADKCEAYRALIEEGAGRGGAPSAAAAHLDACADCRRFAREREALVGLLGGLAQVSAPDDFEFRLRARMARGRGAESVWRRSFRLAPGLAAAGLVACLLAAAALYFRARPSVDNQTAARAVAPAAPAPEAAAAGGESPRGEVARAEDKTRAVGPAVGRPDEPLKGARLRETAARRNPPGARRATREGNFGVVPAPVIKGGEGGEVASHSAALAVPLPTSPETLRVVLRDERGGAYVVPMRSVSFGAQGPVARGARGGRASHAYKEGVW